MADISLARRLVAAIAHASWIVVGFGAVWLPLIFWLLFRKDAFVRPHAKQALAWQILSIVFVGVVGVGVVLAGLADTDMQTAAIILCVAIVPTVIFPFIGTVKALAKEPYGYPLVKKLVEDVAS